MADQVRVRDGAVEVTVAEGDVGRVDIWVQTSIGFVQLVVRDAVELESLREAVRIAVTAFEEVTRG